ncbi:Developmentally regulated G-protein 2 [Apostasia shenzhenica]|uniref:Developmentally regulated G-protein 2 n=1 Tax=Apostasia shenzhenica TaxID=1088818 RepID=A0A2I0ARN1_9ASPA|nr:Developmentally regulated G-protein 2 [Apostasia shenzhenica]
MWRKTMFRIHKSEFFKPMIEECPWISMVGYYSDFATKKKGKATPLQERRMVDRFRIWAKGGEGGNGCWSYRRSRADRHGVPNGGNGGRGGDVYLECSPTLWDFSNLQHHLNAKRGEHGISKNMIGTRGSDKVVQVPVGTVIHLVSGASPRVVRKNSPTLMDPWEIPVLVNDDQSSFERNKPKENKIKTLRLDITGFNGEIQKSISHCSNEHKDNQCGDYWCAKESEEHDNDDWWKDDNDWWKDDNNDEEDGECHFELEEQVQYSVMELTEPGQQVLIAQGGEGGLGNTALSKNMNHRKLMKPNGASNTGTLDNEELFSLIAGKPGSESVLILELKSIADVGLVGMPNTGKSTLLSAISRANPAVGHYAFTTLRPNIGNLNYDDYFSISVADIPGLIRGAHENRGLGHTFLRHIERTKVLAYVVDLAAGLDGRKGIMPWDQLHDLVLELEHYQAGLSDRPSLIVANKIDEEGAEIIYEELKRRVQDVPIFPVCAILGDGVLEFTLGLRKLIEGKETHKLRINDIKID